MFCKFCNREASTLVSNSQHELYCKSNPNAKSREASKGMLGKKGTNQYAKGAKMAASTKEKIREASKKQIWTEERREKHSVAMKKAVLDNPESYTSANRGRTKQIEFDGIKFQGKWELDFYKWAKGKGLNPKRVVCGFHYQWNGERTYFPDFYIESKDLYIEVKGFKTDRDEAKWSQFPKKLLVVDRKSIDNIRKGCYNLD